MNIFKTIGKLGYRTQKASTTIIKHPKQAWSDIKQGYEEGKQFDAYVNGKADTLESYQSILLPLLNRLYDRQRNGTSSNFTR